MTAETDLLPMPEWDGDFMTESEFREKAQSYARANLAERDAEVEALQYRLETAEAYGLQCDADIRSLLARAERLAEALRLFLRAGVGNSTDFYIQLDATREARAALAQESNDA